jgi:CheY-like chemotaxis protein
LAAEPVTAVTDPEPIATNGFHGAVVLVVDDQPAIRRGMETLLESWGCRPLLARNGEEALAQVKAHSRAPDFIIADYQLGGGATCLDMIAAVEAACGRKLPTVIVTGDTRAEDLRQAQASGHLVLHKPVMPARLRTGLTRLLGRA